MMEISKTTGIILMILGVTFFVIGIKMFDYSSNDDYTKGYKSGYKDAKLIYECDHDRAECEIIKDTL